MPFPQNFDLTSPTGAILRVCHAPAEGKPCGVLQINHGLAEHGARYHRFAKFLSGRGFHVYAHDHRGHGATTAPDAPPRVFSMRDGSSKVIADCVAVHDMIGERHPGLPVIAFGHSMGALICLNFVLRFPERVSAAAIWNGNFSAGTLGHLAKGILAWERMRLGSDVPSQILPRLTFQAWAKSVPDAQTPFDWLSRDREEVAKYIADPLCGWDASVSMYQDVLDFIFFVADDTNFAKTPRNLPFHLVGGESDPSTNGGRAVTALANRMQKMGFSNVTTRIYPGNRHESLNEINRDTVMDDFAVWAGQTLKRAKETA
jgi:alpha-beta hydrolase superfamily lysophospholipase